jgi:excisionase family DNA binding protein
VFDKEFIDRLLDVARPDLKALVREVLADQGHHLEPLCVNYAEAARILGTTYEAIRKLVARGVLQATGHGRKRCIAISELHKYAQGRPLKGNESPKSQEGVY